MSDNVYQVMHQRGLIAQSTDNEIERRLAQPVTAYIGFDPTADSLHVGSLVPVMTLAWLQRCGHRPLVVVGGATGLIGDPSGKSSMRQMLTRQQINDNAQAIAQQIGSMVRFGDGPSDAALRNNIDWLGELSWIDLLREVGGHMSVNRMLTMDSVKARLAGGGISFLEFNYMVLQAYDFLHLYRQDGCTLQMGGQDQWGNIVMGIELGRRLADVSLAGLTVPLITKADGGKFGKSESGNIWLSPERTSPFNFYQFWRNAADADVDRFLRFFTFLSVDEIQSLTTGAQAEGAAINEAKKVLAHTVTALVHGQEVADQAAADAAIVRGSAAITGDAIPHGDLPRSELETGVGLLTLLVRAGLANSNGEARRLVKGGGVRVHDQRCDDPAVVITDHAIEQGAVLLRAGKKRLYRFDVV